MISPENAHIRIAYTHRRTPAALARSVPARTVPTSSSSARAATGTMISLPRSTRRRTATLAICLTPEQRVRDGNHARPDDDHEQCREQAGDQREHDLHRHLLRPLLGPLTAPDPHFGRLLAKYPGHRNANLARLDQRSDEGPEFRHGRPGD